MKEKEIIDLENPINRPVTVDLTNDDDDVQVLRTLRKVPVVQFISNNTLLKSKVRKKRAPREPEITPAMLKCQICQHLADKDTPLCATTCGHIFCEECLKTSLKHSNNCPNCRTKIKKRGGYHRLYL